MFDIQFAHPGWLALLALIPVPLLLERSRPRIVWPSFADLPPAQAAHLAALAALLARNPRGLAIGALAMALRPQTVGGTVRIAGHGVAIVVALDQSSSMSAADFAVDQETRHITRLEAAKITFTRFVEGRPDDAVGLVVFANYPDLVCSPTLDHRTLIEIAGAIHRGPGDDGTNIGDAIAWALDALRNTTPSKRVLILLTDGNNEPGGPHPLDPEVAAALARDLGVVLHTIAIGHRGGIVRGTEPGTNLPVMAEIEGPNIALLERLASITGGRSFVAIDGDALDEVFQTISAPGKEPDQKHDSHPLQ